MIAAARARGLLLAGILAAGALGCGPRTATAPASASPSALASSSATEPGSTVQTFDDMGRDHIGPGTPVPQYNSNPPTSGPHSPQFVDWGIFNQLPPKEVM